MKKLFCNRCRRFKDTKPQHIDGVNYCAKCLHFETEERRLMSELKELREMEAK